MGYSLASRVEAHRQPKSIKFKSLANEDRENI